jgi:hypothetical protein
MHTLGITLATLLVTRCSNGRVTGGTSRERLRSCWLQLEWLAQESKDYERGVQATEMLATEHRAALNGLVDEGVLSSQVAALIHTSYCAAANHTLLANAPITCYEPVVVDYTPTSSSQLAYQAQLLSEMAEQGTIDADTMVLAQQTIERDIAFLTLPSEDKTALYDELMAAYEDGFGFPSLSELSLTVSPEAAEAAHFLVDLLLQE